MGIKMEGKGVRKEVARDGKGKRNGKGRRGRGCAPPDSEFLPPPLLKRQVVNIQGSY